MPFLSISGSTVYGWLWQVNGNTPLSTTVTLNAWHMLTITYDPSGGGTERFYVDGALVSSGTGPIRRPALRSSSPRTSAGRSQPG